MTQRLLDKNLETDLAVQRKRSIANQQTESEMEITKSKKNLFWKYKKFNLRKTDENHNHYH